MAGQATVMTRRCRAVPPLCRRCAAAAADNNNNNNNNNNHQEQATMTRCLHGSPTRM